MSFALELLLDPTQHSKRRRNGTNNPEFCGLMTDDERTLSYLWEDFMMVKRHAMFSMESFTLLNCVDSPPRASIKRGLC